MSKIWNTLAYRLSSGKMQTYATQKGYPRIGESTIIKEAGLSRSIIVKLEDSEGVVHDVSVKMTNAYAKPEILNFQFSPSYENYTVKRKTKSSNRVFINTENIGDCPEVKAWKAAYQAASHDLYEEYFINLEASLLKELPESAVDAIQDDLDSLIKEGKTKAVKQWFKNHRFTDIPESIDLMKNLGGYEESRRPDGYGHECGTAVMIDWENKKFSRYGWSSDD